MDKTEYQKQLFFDVMRLAVCSELTRGRFDDTKIQSYLMWRFATETTRRTYICMLSPRKKFLGCISILKYERDRNSLENVLLYKLRQNTASVFSVSCCVGSEDLYDEYNFAREIYAASETSGIKLKEHYVLNGNDCIGLISEFKKLLLLNT